MLQRHLRGIVGSLEAVGGRKCGQHRHGALAVAAEENLQQVGLLGLCGQACSGTAALHVEDDERQLHDDGQVHRLTLKADARAGGGGHGQSAGERCSDGRGCARNLVLTLDGLHAQRLVLRQLVEHVGGRRDGVRTEVKLQASLLCCGDEAVGRGLVARDVHIAAGLLVLCLYAVDVGSRRVRVVAVVVTCLNHLDVSFGYGRLLGKLLAQEVESYVKVAIEEPAYEAEGKHIAALEHSFHIHGGAHPLPLPKGGVTIAFCFLRIRVPLPWGGARGGL